eukprot:GHVL01000421.1.p1 GENE.GHVL01000421.1~~GHVL01000421.1.p1  ORF type:complete len:337 (+),score=46.11 GHVL01000421.1:67-1077(+)
MSTMRDEWYPIAPVKDVGVDPMGTCILGDPIVVFATPDGQLHCLADRCPHRSAALSSGRVLKDNTIQCPYHGWRVDKLGNVVNIPSQSPNDPIPKAARVRVYPIQELGGLVWVFPGKPELASSVTPYIPPKSVQKNYKSVQWTDFPIDFVLMGENLLDPAHIPFVHRGTLYNSDDVDPVRLAVEENEDFSISGSVIELQHRSPITMALLGKKNAETMTRLSFRPPCFNQVLIHEKKGNGWKAQLQLDFYSVPTAPEQCRLIIVTQQGINRFIPSELFVGANWDVIFQDLVVLHGQKQRINIEHAPIFNIAVPADILCQQFREWHKKNFTQDIWWKG